MQSSTLIRKRDSIIAISLKPINSDETAFAGNPIYSPSSAGSAYIVKIVAWKEVVASRWLIVRNMGGFRMRMKARLSKSSRSIAIDKTLFVVLDVLHKASKEKEGVITPHAPAV
jgi:hypothetical protein